MIISGVTESYQITFFLSLEIWDGEDSRLQVRDAPKDLDANFEGTLFRIHIFIYPEWWFRMKSTMHFEFFLVLRLELTKRCRGLIRTSVDLGETFSWTV
jgi:hypothetical protein